MNEDVEKEKKSEKQSSDGPKVENTKSDKKSEDNKAEHEKSAEGNSDGVIVPEDFQRQTSSLMQAASTKHHVAHVRSQLSDKEDKMRQAEMREKKNVPDSYTMAGGPSY
jgi:hypothetical protein